MTRAITGVEAMQNTSSRERWASLLVMLAYLAIIVFFVALHLRFSFGPFRALFNSDSASNQLFAEEMIRQRSLFPQWNNSTGIFFPLIMPQFLVMPILIGFLHDGFTSFRAAIAIDQLIMFAGLWWLLGRMGLSTIARLFLIAFLVISPSLPFMMQTTLLAGKTWIYTFLLLLGYLTLQVIHAVDKRQLLLAGAATLVLGGLIFTDVANAAMIVPGLIAALGFQWIVDPDRNTPRFLLAIGCLVGACIVGHLMFAIALSNNAYSPLDYVFTDLPAAFDHLGVFTMGMIAQFGAVPVGLSTYSLGGVASGIKFIALLLILATPFYLLLRHATLQNRYVRLLTVICATSLALRLYVYLFTGISNNSSGTVRYFIVEILLGMTLVLFHVEHKLRDDWVRKLLLLGAITPFAATAPLLAMPATKASEYQHLTQQLQDSGLKLGYSTFWNANVVTGLSNGAVTVRPIEFQGPLIFPRLWLSSNRWYAGDIKASESFLLLDQKELKNSDLSLMYATVGTPIRKVDLGDHVALVYPFDLMTRFAWGQPTDQPLAASQMRATVTALDPPHFDAAGQQLVLHWRVQNLGTGTFTSYGRFPVNLGLHLRDENGKRIENDLARQPLPAMQPEQVVDVEMHVPTVALRDGFYVDADLVQESVGWFADHGGIPASVDIPSQTTNVIPMNSAHAPARDADPPHPPLPRKAGSARR